MGKNVGLEKIQKLSEPSSESELPQTDLWNPEQTQGEKSVNSLILRGKIQNFFIFLFRVKLVEIQIHSI